MRSYQISNGGGRTPAWAPNGHELFFVNRTSIDGGDRPVDADLQRWEPYEALRRALDRAGRQVHHPTIGTHRTYDVSRDGQRFLMIKNNAGSSEGSAAAGQHDRRAELVRGTEEEVAQT